MNEPAMSVTELQRLIGRSPYHQLFDLTVIETDIADELKLLMGYSSSVERLPESSQYHGGTLASLGDIAGAFALGKRLGIGAPTVQFLIDYLRPAIKTDLLAHAPIRKLGKRFAFVDIDIESSTGDLIAICRGVYACNT